MCVKNISKKAQVSDTTTWIIATIIIFVILTFFIFGSTILGNGKIVGDYRKSLFFKSIYIGNDIFLLKSVFSKISLEDSAQGKYIDQRLLTMDEEGFFEESYKSKLKEIEDKLK